MDVRSAPVQCHRARVQGSGVPARVPGFRAEPVLPGPRTDRGRRLLPRRLRRDHRRVRGPRPPGTRPSTCRRTPASGPARNAGMDRATGDYLIFLDGDDTLTPERPPGHRRPDQGDRRPGRPGLRLRAHVLVGRDRPQRPRGPARPSAAPPPSAWPTARTCSTSCMVVWNKAYRREFVERRGLHLPARLLRGHPLDLPGADGRRSRSPSSTGSASTTGSGAAATSSPPPAEALRHLRPVRPGLRLPRRAPRTRRWRPVLFRRMVDHFCAVHASRDRLPRASRAAFFRRATRLLPPLPHPRRPGPPAAPGSATACCASARAAPTGRWRRPARIGDGLRRGAAALRRAAARARRSRRTTASSAGCPLRARTGGLRRLRGRGLRVQPGRARGEACASWSRGMRTAWIATPAHARTVPPATRTLHARHRSRTGRALARSTYLVNNVDFDRRLVQAARPGPPPDPPRHPAQARRHSTSRTGPRPPGTRTSRSCCAASTSGTTSSPANRALHPRTGSGPTRPRTRRWSTAPRATTSSTAPDPADVARLRETLGIPRGRHGHPVRADAPRLPPRASGPPWTWSG